MAGSLLASEHAFSDVPRTSYTQPSPNIVGAAAIDKLLAEAQKALGSGNVRLALIYLRNAVSAAPRNGAARVQLGKVLLQVGDEPGAERELRQAQKDGAPDLLVLPPLFQVMLSRN